MLEQKQSIIGSLNIGTNSGTIINGNCFNMSPTESSISFKGSGTDVSGDHARTFSFINITIRCGTSPIEDSPSKLNSKVSKFRSKLPGSDSKENKPRR